MDFAEGLGRVRSGELTFDAFARATRAHWRRLAHYVARRWRLPVWASVEDLEQDLLLGAWESVWKWDPGRGPTLAGYVTYNSIDKAKKSAHRYRHCKRSGNPDRNPPRFERGYAAVWGAEDGDRRAEEKTATAPSQERELAAREAYDKCIRACTSEAERAVVRAAAREGLLEEAMVGDPLALAGCALALYAEELAGSPEEALRLVVEVQAAVLPRVSAWAA